MNGTVLHAESNHSFTLSIFHQEVQGKVLNKVTGVVTKRLYRRIDRDMTWTKYRMNIRLQNKSRCVALPCRKVYAVASVLSCLLHNSIDEPGLLFHTWDSDHQRLSGRSSRLQCGWMACQNSLTEVENFREAQQPIRPKLCCCIINIPVCVKKPILMWCKNVNSWIKSMHGVNLTLTTCTFPTKCKTLSK